MNVCQRCFRPDAKSALPQVPLATVCRGCQIELERTIGWLQFYGLQLSLPESTTLADVAVGVTQESSTPLSTSTTLQFETVQLPPTTKTPKPPQPQVNGRKPHRPRKAAEAPRIAN